MSKFLPAATLFAVGGALGLLGMTILLAGVNSLECGCYVLSRD